MSLFKGRSALFNEYQKILRGGITGNIFKTKSDIDFNKVNEERTSLNAIPIEVNINPKVYLKVTDKIGLIKPRENKVKNSL